MSVVTSHKLSNVRVVTMNRPDALNAFSAEMMDDLCDAFIEAADDPETKVLVLTGAGRAFSSGADLKAMGTTGPLPKHGLAGLLDSIIEFPKPFLIAANGLGVGIGCTLLGLADMAFAADSARFKCPFSALGLTAEAASTVTFPGLIGHQKASWILLASEWVSAEEAKDAGLILAQFPSENLMDEVLTRAQTLAQLPLASLVQTKALMMRSVKAERKAAVLAENDGLNQLSGGAANREAVKAFIEQRTPDFSGL